MLVPKPALDEAGDEGVAVGLGGEGGGGRVDEERPARDALVACDVDEGDRLCVAWLEADCGACCDVEAAEERGRAVEEERTVRFGEVEVRANLGVEMTVLSATPNTGWEAHH